MPAVERARATGERLGLLRHGIPPCQSFQGRFRFERQPGAGCALGQRFQELPGFGRAAETIDRAVVDLLEATQFLQTTEAEGRSEQALAAATPYLRQFALTAGAASLARAALAGDAPERVALCRFHCENLLGEAAALKQTVIGGSESLLAAGAALVA